MQSLERGACQGRLTDEVTPGINQAEGFVKEVERRAWVHGPFSDPALHSTWPESTVSGWKWREMRLVC